MPHLRGPPAHAQGPGYSGFRRYASHGGRLPRTSLRAARRATFPVSPARHRPCPRQAGSGQTRNGRFPERKPPFRRRADRSRKAGLRLDPAPRPCAPHPSGRGPAKQNPACDRYTDGGSPAPSGSSRVTASACFSCAISTRARPKARLRVRPQGVGALKSRHGFAGAIQIQQPGTRARARPARSRHRSRWRARGHQGLPDTTHVSPSVAR